MSSTNEKNPADIIKDLDDEARQELLEHLADELGFDLTEQPEPIEPQSEIIEPIEGAIGNLQRELALLKTQFSEGTEPEYLELNRAAEGLEAAVAELSEARTNLDAFIDAEFDVEDEEDEEEEEDDE